MSSAEIAISLLSVLVTVTTLMGSIIISMLRTNLAEVNSKLQALTTSVNQISHDAIKIATLESDTKELQRKLDIHMAEAAHRGHPHSTLPQSFRQEIKDIAN